MENELKISSAAGRAHRVRVQQIPINRVRVRFRVQKFLNFKQFTGSGPTKTLNRPGPGRVRVQQILISRVRVRVQKFLDPMGSSCRPNSLISTVSIRLTSELFFFANDYMSELTPLYT
jgi:hypothetical protein